MSKTLKTSKNPFGFIKESLLSELKKVDKVIIDNSKNKSGLIPEVTNHLVLSGGKRIRPILTILCAKLCGYDFGDRHFNLAAAVELIHTATLLHDDVVDDSVLRRGKETSNAIWGNKASILVGDYLLSVAFQLAVKDGSLEILDILSHISGVMSDGEVLQLMNKGDIEISSDTYFKIISSKTAILFSATTQMGPLIVGNSKQQEALKNFGNNLGIAFQIMDDALDYHADQKALGKDIGDDFFEGKVTLPIILVYQAASEEERVRMKEVFSQNMLSDQKDINLLEEVMELIEKYNILAAVTNKALEYEEAAKRDLDIFDDCEEKDMLLSILKYCVQRNT